MSGLFGGTAGSKISQQPVISQGIQIQTSVYGVPLAIAYGTVRAGGNLIWYNDFTPIAPPPSSGGGKGGAIGGSGKGPGGSSAAYTYSVALDLALCEGPVDAIGLAWYSQTQVATLANLSLTLFDGTFTQAAPPYVVAHHPTQAEPYTGVAHVMGNVSLGNSASLPNYNFEIRRLAGFAAPNGIDADPSLIFPDLITSIYYGVGLDASRVGTPVNNSEIHTTTGGTLTVNNAATFVRNLDVVYNGVALQCIALGGTFTSAAQYYFDPATGIYTMNEPAGHSVTINYVSRSALKQFQNFTMAQGLWISPIYRTQAAAQTMLDEIANDTNSEVVWSQGMFNVVPRGATSVVGNGFTYIPPAAALFSLTDDDFVDTYSGSANNTLDPVVLHRTRAADQINNIKQEFTDRTNQYATSIAETYDQALIDRYQRRPSTRGAGHLFCDPAAANTSAQLQLQKESIRNRYYWTGDQRWVILDPMNVVNITDARLGTVTVRVTNITEMDDGTFQFVAEEYPLGLGATALYNINTGNGFIPDYGVNPGPANAPIFIEPPAQLTSDGYEVWVASAGGANWGGALVWVSTDGGNSYVQRGEISGPSTYGYTTSSLPAFGGLPDSQGVSVNLTVSNGAMLSHQDADAANLVSLIYVGFSNTGEIDSYDSVALTSPNSYNVTIYQRSIYNGNLTAIPSGTPITVINSTLFKFPYDTGLIGSTIQMKLQSFNTAGTGLQPLADAVAYPYTIVGPPRPPQPQNLATTLQPHGILITWTSISSPNIAGYQVSYTDPAGMVTNIFIDQGQNTQVTINEALAGNYHIRVSTIDTSGKSSLPSTILQTILPPNTPVLNPATFSGGNIVFTWSQPPLDPTQQLPIAFYNFNGTYGASAQMLTLYHPVTAQFVGTQTFTVQAVDSGGNISAPATVNVTINAPSVAQPTAQVIDNNVLLRWDSTPGTLPISTYIISKGSTYGTSATIGTTAATFDVLFETVGGTYTYWVVAVDSAGNRSVPQGLAVTVNPPPNYVFNALFTSAFAGTKTNCYLDPATTFLIAPVSTSETWHDHFANAGWTNIQDQINAGYPLYIQGSASDGSTPSTGSYVEVFDYGTTLPSSMITVTALTTVLEGGVTVTPLIEISTDNISYTSLGNVYQALATSPFRYVRVTLTFASSPLGSVIEFQSFTVRLDVKTKQDGGNGTATTATGGTTVTLNVSFANITSITVTPATGGTAQYAISNFTALGPNPTTFKMWLYNSAGAQVAGPFSWQAFGV